MDNKFDPDIAVPGISDDIRVDLLNKKTERQIRSHEWLQTLETWTRELIDEALRSGGEARGKDRPNSAV